MLGAAPVTKVIAHSEVFVDALVDVAGTVVDLGSGGGVPGLVIAWRRPDLRVVLVDRRTTRTDHLRRLIARLGLGSQVSVLAAEARHLPGLLDAPVAAVVARGFGRPEVVASAAAPILSTGGLLVVSEPPSCLGRWASPAIAASFLRQASASQVAVLRLVPRGAWHVPPEC